MIFIHHRIIGIGIGIGISIHFLIIRFTKYSIDNILIAFLFLYNLTHEHILL